MESAPNATATFGKVARTVPGRDTISRVPISDCNSTHFTPIRTTIVGSRLTQSRRRPDAYPFTNAGTRRPAPRAEGARRARRPLAAGRRAGARAGRERRRVDHAREGLLLDPLQQADPDYGGQRDPAPPGLDLFHRRPRGASGAAARGQEHDVRG